MSSPTTTTTSTTKTNSGIITDETSGERHIPESVRADGSKRRAIKIRPGYQPPEDVEVYKNRPAEAHRERGKRIGIPGAAGLQDDDAQDAAVPSSASNKNAKRREARKKAKVAATEDEAKHEKQQQQQPKDQPAAEVVDPEVDREKKARNLRKKLKQAKELKMKKDGGEGLLPEQIAKVIKINELVRELEALGFGPDGEPKDETKGPVEDGEQGK